MLMMLALKVTVLYLLHMYQRKNASFNSLARICPMILMSNLFFKNNSAAAGSVLYGGVIDNCKLTYGLDSYSSGEVFDMIVHIDNDNTNFKHFLSPTSSMPM